MKRLGPALACAFAAGCLWWHPLAAFLMSLAIPVGPSIARLSAALFAAGLLAALASGYFFAQASRARRQAAALPLFALSGLLFTHAAGSRLLDLSEKLDPFDGAPSAHDSCAPDVATSLTVLAARASLKKGSPYIDVALDVESALDVEVSPAGWARDERSGARFAMEVEPARLPAGRSRLTLRLMDADGRRRDGLVFRNLAVYLRSPSCNAQPRATLVPLLSIAAR